MSNTCHLRRAAAAVGTTACLAGVLAGGHSMAQAATTGPSLWANAATTTQNGADTPDTIQFHATTGTIPSAAVGQQLTVKLDQITGWNIDCNLDKDNSSLLKLRYADSSGVWHDAAINWYLSGCWTGGATAVTTITTDMVGQQVTLYGFGAPNSGASKATAQVSVTIGSSTTTTGVQSFDLLSATTTPTTPVTPTPTPTKPVTPTPTPTQPSGKTMSQLSRIPWEGGASYYNQFADAKAAGWGSQNHFPIMLWWGQGDTDANLQADKAWGINTYIATNDDTTAERMSRLGMSYIGTQKAGATRHQSGWVGDFYGDEIDGKYSDADKIDTGLKVMDDTQSSFPDHDKFRYANFTGMLISWYKNNPTWDAASNKYMTYTDAASLDSYWFSGYACDRTDSSGQPQVFGDAYITPFTATSCRTAQNYGRTVDSMRIRDAKDGKLQPIYNFIEDTDVAPDGYSAKVRLTPLQVKGAAISSLIHEARGIAWFNNSFGGACQSGNAIRDAANKPGYACKDTVDAAGQVSRQIEKLAPVLNTQSYAWSAGIGVETMLKSYNGSAYLFAMPADQGVGAGAGTKTFTLPADLANKTITVVDENRSLKVSSNATFTDNFTDLSSYHIYKIG